MPKFVKKTAKVDNIKHMLCLLTVKFLIIYEGSCCRRGSLCWLLGYNGRLCAVGGCENTVLTRSTSSGNMHVLAGDLSSGRAFDNGCTCRHIELSGSHAECRCGAPRLRAQLEFVGALVNISKRLSQLSTKDMRSKSTLLHSV